jgi:hypothetical protein
MRCGAEPWGPVPTGRGFPHSPAPCRSSQSRLRDQGERHGDELSGGAERPSVMPGGAEGTLSLIMVLEIEGAVIRCGAETWGPAPSSRFPMPRCPVLRSRDLGRQEGEPSGGRSAGLSARGRGDGHATDAADVTRARRVARGDEAPRNSNAGTKPEGGSRVRICAAGPTSDAERTDLPHGAQEADGPLPARHPTDDQPFYSGRAPCRAHAPP